MAPPITRCGSVRTGDQTTASPMPCPLGHGLYAVSDVNLMSPGQSPVQGRVLEFWPSRSAFPSPSDSLPGPRGNGQVTVTLPGYLQGNGPRAVTSKSCCLRCSATTCCKHLVSTVTGEGRRLGCGPVTHLVRSGPSLGLAGLGRTGLSGSSLPVPLGPGPVIFCPRGPRRRRTPAPRACSRLLVGCTGSNFQASRD
jgi:hypothetical protein